MSRWQTLLNRQLSVRQLMHLAIMGIVVVVIPYLTIGVFWAANHSDHLEQLTGADRAFSLIGEVIAWPILLIANVELH
ncbi:hypothetical protein GOARA_021_00560 [Gordonia araii NBRC 100433]|uniref:Uncharacterized protein n=1 Tax=Gordonia araii NBRC 100433 TaxID=1073574 RepID=G7GYZ4_9ACTN|nr:hypothetical protein [Gordonia araii]NNG97028.1 hypothetical protein [Gordonia araii NBRC 100433]GAB08819.1 hypothetical protein GOARA_021_00560 [Gordonia araii NBRC 100433]